jgi:hypothetical protein
MPTKKPAAKEETALAVPSQFELPAIATLDPQTFAEQMDGLQFDFSRVKVPSGGQTSWELPDETVSKELLGVIIDQFPINAYWVDKFSGANNPPDCASMDGKSGVDRDGIPHLCEQCPNNQWGSDQDGSNGKACKNMRRVYLLLEGEALPILLTLPPSALKPFGDFMAKEILCKGRLPYHVVTKIGLTKATSKGGITFSLPTFAVDHTLDKETIGKLTSYTSNLRAMTRGVKITAGEYITTASESSDIC